MIEEAYPQGCPFLPGSPEKVEVLIARAARNMPLFLDTDAVDCRLRTLRSLFKWKDERIAVIIEGRAQGLTYVAIARQLGVSVRSIYQLVWRLKRRP